MLNTNSSAQEPCIVQEDCSEGEFCLDGYCCTDNCIYPCMSCGLPESEGACLYVPRGTTDPKGFCSGEQACDGKGACLAANGFSCTIDNECASGQCVDGVCCNVACDKTCESCAQNGLVGTCSPVPYNTDPDNECLGPHPSCGGMCDGNRSCKFPGVGNDCGVCKACDGKGDCLVTPRDDADCGPSIDCDGLDNACRDYHNLTGERCDAFGSCKKPNDPATCTQYTDIPGC